MGNAIARSRGCLGVSLGAMLIGLALPGAAHAQAAAVPQQPSPGSPPHTDPSPAQTAVTPAGAADPAAITVPADPAQAAADGTATADVVVTGFRQSLEAAINLKRNSVAAVDAIVAEDIAKFPDQNLAESLQRIPGISIQRDAGEGRAITVRGLGAQFTRVRVNGLETVATSTDGAAANRDRAFDFNVFASELFNSLVVHKTAEASLDEGSLGAVVDLNTGNPLGGKYGLTLVGSVQGSYNDLSETLRPRAAGLISWKSPGGTLGIGVSAAYSKTSTLELGNNTVRWAQARFDSVNGTPCFYTSNTSATPAPNTGTFYRPSTACDTAALAFHPRIPRYGEVAHRRERLGLTGSLQWAPNAGTKVSIDALYSRFREDREEKWGEVLLRSNERSVDVVNPVYDTHNNLIAATLNDAYIRTEHYLRQSETEFYQFGGSWDQDVTDKFRFTVLGGVSRSAADIPLETTLALDNRTGQNYRYDYTDMRSPVLTFGTDVNNPANFQLAEIRDRPSNVTNRFRTGQLRAEWDVAEGFQIKAGGVYRRFSFDSIAFTRDTVVCGNGGADLVLGTITCSTTANIFAPGAVYGFPATGLTETFTLGNAGQPGGTTSSWQIASLPAATAFTKLYGRTPIADTGNTRGVVEKVTGGYLEFDAKGDMLGLRYALNAGIRYAHTDQTSYGYNSGVLVNVARSYDDWLPAVNVALFPTEQVILRGAVAKVVTRPTLGNLTPGGSVDGFNYRVSFGNPFLEPYRATNFDLAAEWYFARGSVFSVAVFQKNVESFPISSSFQSTFAATGLPKSVLAPSSPAFINFDPNQVYTVTANVNGTGARLRGVEIAVQGPFRFLPGFLHNFGGIVNVTLLQSTAAYTQSGPATSACVAGATPTTACAFGGLPSVARTETLVGLSKRQANATLFYEDRRFSARASVSYRGPYIDAISGTGNLFEGYDRQVNVDASVRYKLFENLELSVEGTNLTDDYRYRYTDLDTQRNYENNHFGRTILFGARVKI